MGNIGLKQTAQVLNRMSTNLTTNNHKTTAKRCNSFFWGSCANLSGSGLPQGLVLFMGSTLNGEKKQDSHCR
jgi:hypothetical protein